MEYWCLEEKLLVFFQGDFYRDDKLKHPWDSLIPAFQSLGEYFGVDCTCLV